MRKYTRTAFWIAVLATTGLLMLSTKLVGHHLYSQLEKTHPPVPIELLDNADYIVLLGGSIGVPESPRVTLEFGFIGDRVLHARRIYDAGKAQKIIAVGGNAVPEYGVLSEAQYLSALLQEQGIPESDLILEQRSRDTRENAMYTAAMFDRASSVDIILVTSAYHMPRAFKLFHDAGFKSVVAASTDFHVPDRRGPLWTRLIPSSTGLALSSNAIHNMIGGWVNSLVPAPTLSRIEAAERKLP